MPRVSLEFLAEQVETAEQLLAGRNQMYDPQDLPGRYGRAVRAVDRVLAAMQCESVLAGGWAVWRHGYAARVTQDLDVVLPADRVDEFLRVASVSGFERRPLPEGRWPKVLHKDSDIEVDILPENARPGTASRPAPTTIPHPATMGAGGVQLNYISLPALIELKLAAGRIRDDADVIELIRTNTDEVEDIRKHLTNVHDAYVAKLDELVARAEEQVDN